MGLGGSKPTPPPAPVMAPPPSKTAEPEPEPEKKDALNFGWEEKVYGGAFKQSKSTLQRQLTQVDEMAIWRLEARSLRLMEIFEEASDALSQRPADHPSRFPPGLDLNEKVEQACHRQCIEVRGEQRRARTAVFTRRAAHRRAFVLARSCGARSIVARRRRAAASKSALAGLAPT
jgi:hypothetical protein